ncbi:nitric oxide synthase oxygenase [Paenibacillus athensensis]|uniref:nitric oxide synthase oxygenase n=1 Tax=Paenibacillus athensensis TaxID=1967502 RepID=UPI001ADD94B7
MEEQRQIGEQAAAFIRECYGEWGKGEDELQARLDEVARSIALTGSYVQTEEEARHGARMAWRNSSRCIGRLFWKTLEVFDERELDSEEAIAEALLRHMRYATNGGRVRPAITLFAPRGVGRQIRIWNHQLVRYAGYETERGLVGDPASLAFTAVCRSLGWKGAGGPFDVLPLVVQVDDRPPRWYAIPEECVLEVPLTHPQLPGFAELGLKWYAVPFIADMRLEIGGLSYTAAPFNGWYMETEIGARNLADANRYDQLPRVAELMSLDTSTHASLWKDRALVELNAAVLHSFRAARVSVVDHHTAAEQFQLFEQQEAACGRAVNGNWSWLIPPMSPATTAIWAKSYKETRVTPNYFYQKSPYAPERVGEAPAALAAACPFHASR